MVLDAGGGDNLHRKVTSTGGDGGPTGRFRQGIGKGR